MVTIKLDGSWQVCPLDHHRRGLAGYGLMQAGTAGWLPATVPGEVHLDLVRAGLMPEPLVSDHVGACRWPEEKSWWYRRTFEVTAEFLACERQQLLCEGLDLYAEVFLNGGPLGTAANAFVPAAFAVNGRLREGGNELVIRLTAGSELAADAAPPTAPLGKHYLNPAAAGAIPNPARPGELHGQRNWPGRKWLRKAQFCYGWDWSEPLPNIGITRPVRLEGRSHVVLHSLQLDTMPGGGQVELRGLAVLENLHPWSERAATLELALKAPDGRVIRQRLPLSLPVGRTTLACCIPVPDARLWWPNGMGAQPLYHVTARVLEGRRECDRREFDVGLRTVELDRTPLREGSRFCLKVNGQEVFCRGANWGPADALLSRVDAAKYEALVEEARQANFNMFRINGVGTVENEAFYAACDRAGILLWHDFMFACGTYPDDDPAFCAAVRTEAEAIVTALRHHPSIALWCGCNENIWGFAGWWGNDPAHPRILGGTRIYNQILPEVCTTLDPGRPYWPCSPCGGATPNDELVGNCHWWHPFFMNPDMQRRIRHEVFDECRARFVSEFGAIGPCHHESVAEYLAAEERRPDHPAWRLHTNTFEKETMAAAIGYHYADPAGLTVPEYLLYGQLFQGFVLGHGLEALRFRQGDPEDDCRGALVWSYSDCWGETGWSIVDYYLRRKVSYYWLKRACAPVKVIIRQRGQTLVTRVVNDTLAPCSGTVQHGWFRLDGSASELRTSRFVAPSHGHREVAREPLPSAGQRDPREWVYAAVRVTADGTVDQCVWPLVPHRQLALSEPVIQRAVRGRTVILSSPVYCHAVHVEDHGRELVSDNYFDLLPGIPQRLQAASAQRARGLTFTAVMPKP